MLNDKFRSELEQSQEFIAETFPPLLYNLYVNLVKQGFDRVQALELVKVYITATLNGTK